jgi:hypothetical protein
MVVIRSYSYLTYPLSHKNDGNPEENKPTSGYTIKTKPRGKEGNGTQQEAHTIGRQRPKIPEEEEQDENINRESEMGTRKKKKKLQLQEGGREGYERMILDDG